MRNSVGIWIGVGVLVAVGVAVLLITPDEGLSPFDAESSKPDGYRGIALLLADVGVEVRTAEIDADSGEEPVMSGGSGYGIVVPVEEYLGAAARNALEDAARSGATVVVSGTEGFLAISDSALTRSQAAPVPRGFCDIAALESLESIDDIDGFSLGAAGAAQVCFESGLGPLVTSRAVGDGTIVELASPYLWANSRLQPDKEDGGQALDNGPMAVALLGGLDTVTFIVPTPPPDFLGDGSRSPIELMPLPVKMALLQAIGAFVIYAMWKGRRLGRPVSEEMPVEIAGSELTEAVGGLLRRSGSPGSAAEVLRCETHRELSRSLGVPLGGDPAALVSAVAARSGRDPGALHALLFGGAISTTEDLISLSRSLDELELEVLDVQHA